MSINRFEVEIDRVNGYGLPPEPLAVIRIDGQPLIEVVTVVESALVDPDDGVEAGAYEYLDARDVLLPSRLLLGRARNPDLQYGDKVSVLECSCRCFGCHPLLVKIDVGEEFVAWRDFEQPQRPQWACPSSFRFTFDRADYENQLATSP